MSGKIGKLLLLLGLLATAGTIIWGLTNGIFSIAQSGESVGLRRLFFFFLYLPVPLSIVVIGFVLIFRDRLTRNIPVSRIALIISVILLLIVANFTIEGVARNIRYYGGRGVLQVLMQNFVFTIPLFFLSGLLFFLSWFVTRE